MSIGIIDDTEGCTVNYGSTSNKDGFPVTYGSTLEMVSITRAFTATAVMQLVEQIDFLWTINWLESYRIYTKR